MLFNEMNFRASLLFILTVQLDLTKICLSVDTKILSLCTSQSTCDNCLEASLACAWCSDWSYTNSTYGKPRCNVPERLRAFGCPDAEIRAAPPASLRVLTNMDFQDVSNDRTIQPVQLRPQKLRLRMRPRSSQVVTLQYRPAKNYPLDLYYLMDLTWSMKDDKETLVGLGWKIANTLGTFTTNFRLGFGSYADKPLMPYIFPKHEENPCKSENAVCKPLYSFWHHLELTDNIPRFIHQVNYSSVTGNVDNLEGGLDGIVQAIVCDRQVGWAHQARKLMLVATDGLMHFAGEGKLGGVVERQDFQCHLDERGQYSLAKKYDYSSLAEVSRLLHERKVNLIFAVTEDRRHEYELIANLLKQQARVATLTRNSSNILEIIKSAYHEIVSKVVLRDNATDPLHIRYLSACGSEKSVESNTFECDGIQEGQVYEFKVIVSTGECPRNESLWRQTVVIDDALASEASEVQIEVELLCGCDCKNVENSYCEHGVNECGICKCNFGWSGDTCDCDQHFSIENRLQCTNGEEICSNKGECICGTCSCDKGYNGRFCECSPCDKTDGVECGGRGICDCGVCNCLDGWKGSGCQCPSGNELCIAPGSKQVCAGHGYCDCGQCRCNETDVDGLYYRGMYCESSASAGGSGLCILYNSCVNVTVEYPEKAEELCQSNTTLYKTERVDTVDIDDEHYCFVRTVQDRTVCNIPYIYQFQHNKTVILRIADKTCRTVMHAAFLPAIIFGAVLLFGITGLLMWKSWISMQDRREYAKFEQERQRTVYALDENPLFRPAITRFRVPSMYKDD
ncbi:PREDICTED: integrin beta-nu isoform X1 [Vollenhovia emeryi]|uniref:integrin beta-nu isoform X1 n=2 Tax=Vollenhovia emeryi TaxID=411798 RepID=UPI0005F48A0F|nr:PREDICTED: integrin beta-nu isoform X1 [Vollenhovia emeryi]